MKNYGAGLIRCKCSLAMKTGKRIRTREKTPTRKACPNCGRMVKIIHKIFKRPVRVGVTAVKKSKRCEKFGRYVAALEAELKDLRATLKKYESSSV